MDGRLVCFRAAPVAPVCLGVGLALRPAIVSPVTFLLRLGGNVTSEWQMLYCYDAIAPNEFEAGLGGGRIFVRSSPGSRLRGCTHAASDMLHSRRHNQCCNLNTVVL
jgi:hypothetical protein